MEKLTEGRQGGPETRTLKNAMNSMRVNHTTAETNPRKKSTTLTIR